MSSERFYKLLDKIQVEQFDENAKIKLISSISEMFTMMDQLTMNLGNLQSGIEQLNKKLEQIEGKIFNVEN